MYLSQYSQYDESTYTKQISNYFNTDHYQIDIKKIEPTIIDELINIYDEPLTIHLRYLLFNF